MVMSYPKSGTTWVRLIVHAIFNMGVPAEDPVDIVSRDAILEALGGETVRSLPNVGGRVSSSGGAHITSVCPPFTRRRGSRRRSSKTVRRASAVFSRRKGGH